MHDGSHRERLRPSASVRPRSPSIDGPATRAVTGATSIVREMRNAIKIIVVAMITVLVTASPAAAHGAAGATASNFRTTITNVQPSLDNISIEVKEHGDRLQLKNKTGAEVIVLGYQSEPYLKITQTGIFENRLSPAVYTNANRFGNAEPPSFADATKPPEWHKISNGNVAVWHDHRAHWMSKTPPPIVEGDRSTSHVVIPQFTVPLLVNGKPASVEGKVEWFPPAPKWKWGMVALVAATVVAAVAVFGNKTAAIAVGISALVAGDVIHVSGVLLGGAGRLQTRLGSAITSDLTSLIVWCTGVWVLIAVYRKQREVVAYAGLFTAAVVFLFGGLTDLPAMWDSQVVFGWPAWLARTVVATTVGAGIASVVTSALLVYGGSARTRLRQTTDNNNGAAADE